MTNYSLFLRNFLRFRVGFNNLTFAPEKLLNRTMTLGNKENSVYEVSFKSCGNLYEKWRKEGKFRKLPKGDLEFKVRYFDTHKNISLCQESSVPTVVALHGSPGTCKDYSSLTTYLQQNGVRVVVPSFPGKVDTLIVHSSTVYTGLQLCLEDHPLVKSLVMLNPGTFSYDMKSTRVGEFLMKVMVISSEIPILYKLLQMFGPSILQIIRIPVRADNYLDPLLSCTAMLRGNIPKARGKFLQLSKNRLPMLYAFSNDDPIIGKECSYSLAHLLGFSDSDICIYDTKGALKQNGKETPVLKIISFENGSHYVFWKYADIINREITKFIAKL